MNKPSTTVAVCALVQREGRVLLGQRGNIVGAGEWAAPGGKAEAGESPAAAVLRELVEETGLVGSSATPFSFSTTSRIEHGILRQFVVLFFLVQADGEPNILEPGKCDAWKWFAWNRLPSPLSEAEADLAHRFPELPPFE